MAKRNCKTAGCSIESDCKSLKLANCTTISTDAPNGVVTAVSAVIASASIAAAAAAATESNNTVGYSSDSSDDAADVNSTDSKKLDIFTETKLLFMENPWPTNVYLGNECALRYRLNSVNPFDGHNSSRALLALSRFRGAPQIAIDGPSGTGKSTLAKCCNRQYAKISECTKNVTSGNKYNFCMARTWDYLRFQPRTRGRGVIWDRCAYSNLIFYVIHQLMAVFKNRAMPTEYGAVAGEIASICRNFKFNVIVQLTRASYNVPIVFVVGDVARVQQNLRARNEPKDLCASTDLNYIWAQQHVYRYVGDLIGAVVIDLDVIKLNENGV